MRAYEQEEAVCVAASGSHWVVTVMSRVYGAQLKPKFALSRRECVLTFLLKNSILPTFCCPVLSPCALYTRLCGTFEG